MQAVVHVYFGASQAVRNVPSGVSLSKDQACSPWEATTAALTQQAHRAGHAPHRPADE